MSHLNKSKSSSKKGHSRPMLICLHLLLYVALLMQLAIVEAIDLPTVYKLPRASIPSVIFDLANLVERGGFLVQLAQPLVGVVCIILLSRLFLGNRTLAFVGAFMAILAGALEVYVRHPLSSALGSLEGSGPLPKLSLLTALLNGLPMAVTVVVPAALIALVYWWTRKRFILLSKNAVSKHVM